MIITERHIKIKYSSSKVQLGDINLLYININSIRNKISEIELQIQQIEKNGKSVHLVALTEIKLNEEEIKYYNIEGYTAFYCCNTNKSGGVAIFCKDGIKASLITKNFKEKMNFLCIHINDIDMNIAVFYKIPTANNDVFLNCINNVLENNSKMILVGDFNIDLLSKKPEVKKYLNIINAQSYFILNKINKRMATRVAHRTDYSSSTIIDHVITDLHKHTYQLTCMNVAYSDHKSLLLGINHYNNKKTIQKNENKYSTVDTKKYSRQLNEALINTNTNEYNFENLMKIFEKCEKNTTIQKINKNQPKSKWINDELIQNINMRNKYLKLKNKFPNSAYLNEQYNKYKTLCEKQRRELKYKHNNKQIMDNLSDQKKLWKSINNILYNKNKTVHTQIDRIVKNDGDVTKDNTEMANALNEYFVKVGEKLANDLKTKFNNRIQQLTVNKHIDATMYVRNCNELEIKKLIKEIKPGADIGVDHISMNILKNNVNLVAPIISKAINNCLENENIPIELKTSRTVPIFKNGSTLSPANYRPISIIPAIGKLNEKALCKRITSFISKKKIIHANQYGFQKGSSTTSAASHLVTCIHNALDSQKKPCGAIFIDLKKAFDTIAHYLIVKKLAFYGLRGKIGKILRNWLKNRKQFVKINEASSHFGTSEYGIPQGSNLGPLIFILFINDIFELKLHGTLIMFADDAALVYEHANDTNEMYKQMQSDLNVINNYMYNNSLTINEDKTIYIIFREKPNNNELKINGKKINKCNNIKYLGLTIDNKLNWHVHVENVIKKVSAMAGALKRLSRCTSGSVLKSIYFSYVNSHLSYMAAIWGNGLSAYKKNELQVIQNIAIRNAFNMEYYTNNLSTNYIMKKYKLPNINQIIKIETVCFYHKVFYKIIKCTHVPRLHSHNINTRQRNNVYIQTSRTNLALNNIFNVGARIFNSLNEEIRNIKNIKKFKSNIKAITMQQI